MTLNCKAFLWINLKTPELIIPLLYIKSHYVVTAVNREISKSKENKSGVAEVSWELKGLR